MNRNRNRSISPVTRVYTELQQMLSPNQFDQIFPLINSAINSNNNDDNDIPSQRPNDLYDDNFMDVDPTTATVASLLTADQLADTDNDAVIAHQLQEEEYSRNSILPSFPTNNRRHPISTNNRRHPISTNSKSSNRQTLSDAEYAAQLQADEERNHRRNNQRRLFIPQQNQQRPTNRQHEAEPIPIPSPSRSSRPSSSSNQSSRNNNNNINDLFQLFAPMLQNLAISHSHGAQNLENTSEDFGPNDYENLLELDNSVPSSRLTDDEIKRLPTERFQYRATNNEEENKCNVCWDEFQPNDTLRRLKCLHVYHKICIDPWLKTNSSCPICRMSTK